MLRQPLVESGPMKDVERVFGDGRVKVGERQLRQLGYGVGLAGTDLTVGWEVGELNGVWAVAVLCQYEVAHPDRVGIFERRHHRWNDRLDTRTGERTLVTEAVEHIDAEQRHAPQLRVCELVRPRDGRQVIFPLN